MIELLEREPVCLPKSSILDCDTIAPDSYPPPQPSKPRQSNNLKEALVACNINPFSEDSVDKYKTAVVQKIARTTEIWKTLARITNFVSCLSFFAVLFTGVSALAFMVSETVNWTFWWMFIGSVVILVTSANLSNVLNKKKVGHHSRWILFSLATYEGPIPQFAHQAAGMIAQEYPHAKFYVSVLYVDERALDPFLIVVDGNSQNKDYRHYHVKVWEESDFEPEDCQC